MKNLFIGLFIILGLGSCGSKKEVKLIPLTSTSKEAIENYRKAVFSASQMEYDEENQYFKKAFDLDSNFAMAKIMWNNDFKPGDNRRRLIEAYKNRSGLSEIESSIIAAQYENSINNDYKKRIQIIDSLINKYPDYYELYIISADIKERANDAEGALKRYKEALVVNPDCYEAALNIPDLHVYLGNSKRLRSINLLPVKKRNESEALKYFELASKIRPTAASTPRLLGHFYRSKNELDKALSEYQKAVKLNTDSLSIFLALTYNAIGHVYLLKGDYLKARESYEKFIHIGALEDTSRIFSPNAIPLSYLYEKKYEEAIEEASKSINKIEKIKKESINKNFALFGMQTIIYVAYSHSLKEEEALASLEKLNSYRIKNKEIDLANLVDQKQLENIENTDKINSLNLNINHNILFAHYEEAEKQLIELEKMSKEMLKMNPLSMNEFYKFSAHLNLMKGNINESIDFFNKYSGLDQDKYYYYFYALALKAQGNKAESDKIFTQIADESFVVWQNAIVRDLAKAQVNAGN